MYDLIIIGGGPAGITAGIYGSRQKLNILLITKSFGGQITEKAVMVKNYPGIEEISGKELVERLKRHLEKFDIDIENDEVTEVQKEGGRFIVTGKSKKRFESKAVIVASGATPRPLEVPGEKKFLGRGVSYCVTCDGPFFSDKDVAIIGGGNSAFETAIFLGPIVRKIYILEFGEKVRADARNQEGVRKTGKAEIITSAITKEIRGDEFVKSLIYKDRKSGKKIELAVDGVFIEIGNQPATSFVKGLVDFNKRNEIIVDFETCQTKTPGIFAVGDCNAGRFKQIVIACSEGAKAALAAYEYIRK